MRAALIAAAVVAFGVTVTPSAHAGPFGNCTSLPPAQAADCVAGMPGGNYQGRGPSGALPPLQLPDTYHGTADQSGSCGAFGVTCKPPCNMIQRMYSAPDAPGQLVPNPHLGPGEWCDDNATS